MSEKRPQLNNEVEYPSWNPSGELFIEEEVAILRDSPDWYVELLSKWKQDYNNDVLERIPNFHGLLYYGAPVLIKMREKEPGRFNHFKEEFERQVINDQELIDAVKRKFIEAGYAENRAEKIAQDYLNILRKKSASRIEGILREDRERGLGKNIDESIEKASG